MLSRQFVKRTLAAFDRAVSSTATSNLCRFLSHLCRAVTGWEKRGILVYMKNVQWENLFTSRERKIFAS